jgi:hypothetical protein
MLIRLLTDEPENTGFIVWPYLPVLSTTLAPPAISIKNSKVAVIDCGYGGAVGRPLIGEHIGHSPSHGECLEFWVSRESLPSLLELAGKTRGRVVTAGNDLTGERQFLDESWDTFFDDLNQPAFLAETKIVGETYGKRLALSGALPDQKRMNQSQSQAQAGQWQGSPEKFKAVAECWVQAVEDGYAAARLAMVATPPVLPSEELLQLATKYFGVATLTTRNSSSMDFHEVSVRNLKAALEEAFSLGLAQGTACAKDSDLQ